MPLYYAILPESNVIPALDITEDEYMIYYASHNDCAFQVDNLSVQHIIDQLTTGTYAADYINRSFCNRNGRAECNSLCEHYDRSDLSICGLLQY